MANTHQLKCWSAYYKEIEAGRKPFEVRLDDRGFQKGDILELCEYDPTPGVKNGYVTASGMRSSYPGKKIYRKVSFILTGGKFGIEPGYVVMGLKKA